MFLGRASTERGKEGDISKQAFASTEVLVQGTRDRKPTRVQVPTHTPEGSAGLRCLELT